MVEPGGTAPPSRIAFELFQRYDIIYNIIRKKSQENDWIFIGHSQFECRPCGYLMCYNANHHPKRIDVLMEQKLE